MDMEGFRATLETPEFWQRLLIVHTLVLGVEAPFLLFVASTRRRPWYEQALALVPAAGFALGLYWARQARDAFDGLLSYIAFNHAHYPSRYWPTFAREQGANGQALLVSVQQHAIALGALTLVLLLGGWLLLLRWVPPPRHLLRPRHKHAAYLQGAARLSDGGSEADGEDEQGSLEITFEPIEQEKRT